MVEFTHNNIKNVSTRYTLFELNYGYHFRISYKEEVDPCSLSKLANKLSIELREQIVIYCKNLHHTQELQKRVYDKGVKTWSYASDKKIWLNSK